MSGYPRVLTRRPRHRGVIDRPRLLPADLAGSVVVVVGPAGAGKSVAAAQLADATGARVGWCRLAPGWNRATDIAGLTRVALGADANPNEQGDDLHAAADIVLAELEAEPTCLVIDDLHEAEGGEAEQLLAEVAGFLPDDATIVVTSRRRPAGLIGLVDASTVRIIDAESLAFDRADAVALAADRGVDLDADSAVAATNGWAAAIVATVDSGTESDAASTLAHALGPAVLGDAEPMARAVAALPYATAEMMSALGFGDGSQLDQLVERTSLLTETGGAYRLHASAADLLLADADAERVARIRREAAAALAGTDPITAIELYLQAGAHDKAGLLLADRASEIGAARATRWLYQLPADVRRALPPVLAAGRATVNVNLAIETARRAVDGAADPRAEREALLGLGSLLIAEGELAEAAETLERALRLAADADSFRDLVADELGRARWLAGDRDGAAAAVEGLASPWAAWLQGVIAATAGDLAAAAEQADHATSLADGSDVTTAPGQSLAAAVALLEGDLERATVSAAAAYRTAVDVGGRDLGAAAPVHGWCCLRTGDVDGAAAAAEALERNVARHDRAARLHAALLRRALSAGSADAETRGRDERRVADLRSTGLAPVERWAMLLAGDPTDEEAAPALLVELCGRFRVSVDGSALDASAWKSKKALEVCAVLCQAGEIGQRREQVIEAVWTGRDPDKGRTLLRTALSEIRRVLEPRRGAGQESRFVFSEGDRVHVLGTTDLNEAARAKSDGDYGRAFELLRAGLAADLPDSDWVDELRPVVERELVEAATRVVHDGDPQQQVAAYERLIAVEPWQRDHFDGLAAVHRGLGDDLAAEDVERRWFADD